MLGYGYYCSAVQLQSATTMCTVRLTYIYNSSKTLATSNTAQLADSPQTQWLLQERFHEGWENEPFLQILL